MKKILSLATAFVFTLAVNAQTKVDSVIKMNVETHDFGKVPQGTPVTYDFEIKNISKEPVVVENTWASCGCTTPEKITENSHELINAIVRAKPSSSKGTYLRSVFMASSMSPGIAVDTKSLMN